MGPIIERTIEQHGGVNLERINADEDPRRLRQLGVRAIPTLIAVRNGREIARLTGAQSEAAIESLFALAAGSPEAGLRRTSPTDRAIRGVAAVLLLLVGMVTGPAVPLLAAGILIGATALPAGLGKRREP
jgi:thioredoxin-like negative regulator of GroEL